MTSPARIRLLVVAAMFVLAACGSDSATVAPGTMPVQTPTVVLAQPTPTVVEPATAEPSSATGAPTLQLAATPTPDPTAAPSSTPSSAALATPWPDGSVAIEVWFPKEPESYNDYSLMFPVERPIPAAIAADPELRFAAAVDHWLAGPTAMEMKEGGFIGPLPGFAATRACDTDPFELELVADNLIVTLCKLPGSPGVGADARMLESFRQTLVAAGATDSALLGPGGRQCLGGQRDENPLSCLSDAVVDALGPGFPCPTELDASPGRIWGVNEWVNARIAPSLNADIVGRFDLDAEISFYVERRPGFPSTGEWVAVQQPNPNRCVYVSARFITTATGPLDRAPAGISYDLPTSGTWLLSPRDGALGRTTWVQDTGLYVGVFIDVAAGKNIDEYIATQEAIFEEEGYEPQTDWKAEVAVAGADRALHPISTISESGDLFSTEQWIEVGNYTVMIGHGVYFEDVDDAPLEEMAAFIESIEIDREVFLASVGGQ